MLSRCSEPTNSDVGERSGSPGTRSGGCRAFPGFGVEASICREIPSPRIKFTERVWKCNTAYGGNLLEFISIQGSDCM